MLEEMPYEELLNWFAYFSIRPMGWEDDQRTYMLLQAQGVKEKPEKLFPSIASLKKAQYEDEGRLGKSLISSGLLHKLQTTAKLNNIEWEVEVDQD